MEIMCKSDTHCVCSSKVDRFWRAQVRVKAVPTINLRTLLLHTVKHLLFIPLLLYLATCLGWIWMDTLKSYTDFRKYIITSYYFCSQAMVNMLKIHMNDDRFPFKTYHLSFELSDMLILQQRSL